MPAHAPLHGRHAPTRSALVWQASATLDGLSVWGAPDADGVRAAFAAYDAQDRSWMSVPADYVVDAARVTHIDPDAFRAVLAGIALRADNIRRRLRRFVVVARPDQFGAAIIGLLPAARFGMPWKVCATLGEAFAELGAEGADADALDALVADASAQAEPLGRVRAWVAAHCAEATANAAARATGVSLRSLQRLLAEADTSFRAEVERARQQLAERLLAESELKIGAIAQTVGFSSAANFATAFRRWTGTTPAAHRARSTRP